MNSKNVKVIDEHNIDRNARVMFSFDLDGSDYTVYSIERDEENSNVFISKVIRNLDNTYNMLDIDDTTEKSRLAEIIKTLISSSVSNDNDKLVGNFVTLSDGKNVKFLDVLFNKEQKINVQKTYITTVKKEVVRVAENYYNVEVRVEEPKIENIFPSVTPVTVVSTPEVVAPMTELVLPEVPVMPELVTVPEEPKIVIPEPVVSVVTSPEVPVVETPVVSTAAEPVTVATPEVVVATPEVVTPVAEVIIPTPEPVAVTPITVLPEVSVVTEPVVPVVETPIVSTPVEPVTVATPEVVISTPEVVVPTPEPVVVEPTPGLVFNASKETNLNQALGEVANTTAIPVESIEPVREFGVDSPVVEPTQVVQPASTLPPQATIVNGPVVPETSDKAGFANGKFFMVVAVAFFLASCIFLGYEVFNYFQITK